MKPNIAKSVVKGNVLTLYLDDVSSGWEQWILLSADRHHDNVYCDRRLERAHLDKAAEMKLVCHCVWVEVESWFMGIDPKEHHKLMEICLCCPCCCVGLQNFKKLGPDFMQRFNSIGWKPVCTQAQSKKKTEASPAGGSTQTLKRP